MNYNLESFQNGLKELNISYSDKQVDQFIRFYELLVERNKVMNLTGITDFEDVIHKHFLDSLCLVKALPDVSNKKECKILDLGTGAGFPGIPLKIMFPDLDLVLLDSLNKRILFLQDVIEQLDLHKIIAVHGRAEELARKKEYRQRFDYCVSRAVSNLSSLSEYCLPFVKVGGNFISYKSADISGELKQSAKAVSVLGGELKKNIEFQLPGAEDGRSLVVIEKVFQTPKGYPRKSGTPTKNPIM